MGLISNSKQAIAKPVIDTQNISGVCDYSGLVVTTAIL